MAKIEEELVEYAKLRIGYILNNKKFNESDVNENSIMDFINSMKGKSAEYFGLTLYTMLLMTSTKSLRSLPERIEHIIERREKENSKI